MASSPPNTSPLTASSEMRRLTEPTWPSSTRLKVHASHMCSHNATSASSAKLYHHASSGIKHPVYRMTYAMPAADAYDGPALSCKLSSAQLHRSPTKGLLFQMDVTAV